jgi:putative hydrolase of the HAD superfamily
MTRTTPTRFTDILFDLDNTLYPASVNVAQIIDERIVVYIQSQLHLDHDTAKNLSRDYYESHGLAVRGLRDDYGVNTSDLLEFAHDLDYESLFFPDAHLEQQLQTITLRKSVFSNAPRKHCEKVLSILQVSHQFDYIFDLDFLDLHPKPMMESYYRVLQVLDRTPQTMIFVDDGLRNLIPAYELGMTTIWFGPSAMAGIYGVVYAAQNIDNVASIVQELSSCRK